jgi:hypothetical protein
MDPVPANADARRPLKDESTMNQSAQPIIGLFLVSSLILGASTFARADGGAVRLSEQAGNYRITVFTSPTPLRAGPVDISVLVQDAATGEWAPQAQVAVRLAAHGAEQSLEFPATGEAATNKLLKAAVFRLPDPGHWDVEIAVVGPRGPARVRFEVDAAEAPPRWLDLWLWFTWPAIVVAIFGVHQVLVRRQPLLVLPARLQVPVQRRQK